MRTEKYILKLPLSQPLKDWVSSEALQNGRTLTGEVIFRLEIAKMGLAEKATGAASQA